MSSCQRERVRLLSGRDHKYMGVVLHGMHRLHHCITHAVVSVLMATPSYSVMENVGQDELGLMVCATVVEADFDFTVLLIPEDDSAIGIYVH